jgi:hypothetical protein
LYRQTHSSVSSYLSVNENTLNGNDEFDDEQVTVIERPSNLPLNFNSQSLIDDENTPLFNINDDDEDDDDGAGSVIINEEDEDILI